MTTVITCDPLRGGGILPRASVNGLHFVEADPLRGGGELVDAPIGSKTDIHSILGWTPANNSEGNEIGNPVTVNFKAENSDELDLDLATGTAFDDLGTHVGTQSEGTGIQLGIAAIADDFESYPEWTNPIGNGWTARTSDQGWLISGELGEGQQSRTNAYDAESCMTFDAAGDSIEDVIVSARIRFPSDTENTEAGVAARISGSGSALRGYLATHTRTSGWLFIKRFTGDGVYQSVATIAVTPSVGHTWYIIKIRCLGSGISAKFYKEGDAEPGWSGVSNTLYTVGAVGLWGRSNGFIGKVYQDDFDVESFPPQYFSNGIWTSEPIDVSAAETLASSRINFDTTTPEDTTATLKCRWGLGDTWLTCVDGEPLPGAEYRDDMTAGASKSALELRIDLASTDTSVTPNIDNLASEFDPCIFEDMELVVDGNSATIANGHLVKWGREQVSAGVELDAFDDLTVEGWGFENYRLQGEEISAVLKYDDHFLGDIVFSQLLQAFKVGAVDGYFVFRAGAIEALAIVQYTARTTWSIAYHDYEWTLIDRTQGIHADAWFWVGHVQADDFPGSMLAALAELSDHPGSILAKGYARDDFVGMELIQGYRFDDSIGSILPGLEKLNDFLGLEVVAIRHRTDLPGSVLVYGVNRRNEIEIHTIDSATVAALEIIGFVFPPEAT